MIKFSDRMISENVQVFWAAMQRGEFITDAATDLVESLTALSSAGGLPAPGASCPTS